MRILKFLNNRSVGDRKGQVAIFVALIFQLLFLFFAMVVNVGLLVHHKINLQNSVDLAAYYGGMKQAEVLNAIAHINYQIRQSYKVLAWRYRVLGTAGVNPDDPRNPKNPPVNPVKKVGDPKNQGGQITGLESNGVDWNSSDPNVDKLHTAPAFCISYEPFAETPTGESICKAAAGQTIDALVKPTVVASFIGAVSSAAALTDIANVAAKNDCEYNHYINYYLLAKFLAAYQVDQAQRKALIFHLANNLSTSTSEFLDINGDNASQGIQATLKNNLTAANQDGLVGSPSVFNSLAAGGCGGSGSDFQPPNWLSEIVTYLWANYITCNGSSGGTNYSVANVNVSPADQQIINPQFSALRQADLNLYQFLNSNFAGANSIYRASLGVEKNPWCMAYVGVSAQSEPKIPFSLGTVRLKATGFAKPFGGKIGPWYGNTFPRSAGAESTAGQLNQRADALWPIRCIKGDFSQCLPPLGVQNQPTVNHSRFPGDQAGLAASSVQAEFGKSLFDLGAAPSIKFWTDIEVPQNQRNPNEYDILAWTNDPTKSVQAAIKIRNLEIAAAAPDLFDISYYSIDPDFYYNYHSKLDHYLSVNPIKPVPVPVTPYDIGSSATNSANPISFSVMKQLGAVGALGSMPASGQAIGYGLDYTKQLTYALFNSAIATNAGSVAGTILTSWVPPEFISDYELAPGSNRFGKCTTSIYDSNANPTLDPVPGSCIVGGRSGYSVKLISSDYLLGADHKIGGVGTGPDRILNPPDANFLQ